MVGFFYVPAIVEGFAHRQVVVASMPFDPDEVRVVHECVSGEPFYGMRSSILTSVLLSEPEVKQAGRILQIKKTEHPNGGFFFVLNEEGFCSFVCIVALLYGLFGRFPLLAFRFHDKARFLLLAVGQVLVRFLL